MEEEYVDPVEVARLQRVVSDHGFVHYRFLLEDGTTALVQDAVNNARTRTSATRFLIKNRHMKLVRKAIAFLEKQRDARDRGFPVPVQERAGRASESDDPDVTDWFAR